MSLTDRAKDIKSRENPIKNNHNNQKMKKKLKYSEIITEIENVFSFSEIKPEDYADMDGYADIIAKKYAKTDKSKKDKDCIKTTQLRKFFGAVRDIEKKKEWSDIEPELYLLKPKFAVSVGRKLIPKDFFKVMNVCLNKIDVGETDDEKKENFNTFVKFFEAIVAYHKYYHENYEINR